MLRVASTAVAVLMSVTCHAQDRVQAPVELGVSGTAPSGNITPNFHGRPMLREGIYKELARDISNDPVDPKSDEMIGLIGNARLHVDWAASTKKGGNSSYGMPINVVSGTQALVPVTVGRYAHESDGKAAPIPERPAVEGWIDQSTLIGPKSKDDGRDHHMLIAVRNEATGNIDRLYEMYQVYFDGNVWHSASLAIFDLATGYPRPLSWTSGDAAGLPILPLLVRYDEAAAGAIRHSLRFTLDPGQIRNQYVWPARHAALSGRFDQGIPFGARLRLKRSWYDANKASFTKEARSIVDALFSYGMINSDIGGKLFVQGVADDRWDQSNLLTLQKIPGNAFEVTKLVPLWSITGPPCVRIGVPEQFHADHYPPTDKNVNKGLYLKLNGSSNSNYGRNGMSKERVAWNDAVGNSIPFTFTAKAAGTYVIEGDPAGEYYFPPSPTRVETCP